MRNLCYLMGFILLGLVAFSLSCGSSSTPSSPTSPAPTNTPTPTQTLIPGTPTNTPTSTPTSTATQTATATPTATTCTVYGNSDTTGITLTNWATVPAISEYVHLGSSTTLYSYSFYGQVIVSASGGGVNIEAGLFSVSGSTATLVTGTNVPCNVISYSSYATPQTIINGWQTLSLSSPLSVGAGNYLIVIRQYNSSGLNSLMYGVKGTGCLGNYTSTNTVSDPCDFSVFSPWNLSDAYTASTSNCIEINMKTCP